MAKEGQLSLSSFKEQFDDQLTCSVCLDQYTNPKTLPCLHSFCLHCIEPIPMEIKDGKNYISCPTCRVHHLQPKGGADGFPNDFKINSLLDLRNKLTTSQNSVPIQQATQSMCHKHNDHLKVYCVTCDLVICRDCSISAEHNKHTFHLISECYPKHHQQILGNLDVVKRKLADMNTTLTHLDTREKEVVEQGENVKEQINTHAQQLIDNIQQSRTHLTQQVGTIVQQKTQTLAAQRQLVQKLHTQLKTCQDTIEHSLKEWSQQQILAHKNTMIDEMTSATQHVDPTVLQPIEVANIQFNKIEKEMGSITSMAYRKATLEVSPCTAKQPSTATLTLHSQDGSPFSLPPPLISSTLSSLGNKHTVKCPITQSQPGKYNITFAPSTRNDQLIVQVGGVDVLDSPFTLPVLPTPEMRGEPVNIITGFKKPWGIAVCDSEDIVVAERDGAHCVTKLNKKDEQVKILRIRNDEIPFFKNSVGVIAASTDGHILVTDNHRLQKLTTDGVCVKSVGSVQRGCGYLQFHHPHGIAINHATARNRRIFVADCRNNRIQVFTNDLTFSHTITPSRFGAKFNYPYDIAIDNEGYLYVTDYFSHSITKVTDKGRSIKSFGGKGSAPGQLSSPSFLTIHNNLVYVCEQDNNRVSVFDTDGKFRYQFGGDGLLNAPQGIAMDTSGNLYVCDTGNNRILVF